MANAPTKFGAYPTSKVLFMATRPSSGRRRTTPVPPPIAPVSAQQGQPGRGSTGTSVAPPTSTQPSGHSAHSGGYGPGGHAVTRTVPVSKRRQESHSVPPAGSHADPSHTGIPHLVPPTQNIRAQTPSEQHDRPATPRHVDVTPETEMCRSVAPPRQKTIRAFTLERHLKTRLDNLGRIALCPLPGRPFLPRHLVKIHRHHLC